MTNEIKGENHQTRVLIE